MATLNPNVNQLRALGHRPDDGGDARRDCVGSTVLHGVINEIVRGFPVLPVLPCEGVGYEIGSMAIIKGARNLDAAKKFVDWALTARGAADRARRQGVRDPDEPQRAAAAAGAEAHRHQGHQLRLREVRRERRRASACSSAGRRRSTPTPRLTRSPRGPRARVARSLARGRRRGLRRSCRGTRCRTRCSSIAWLRNWSGEDNAPALAAGAAARPRLAVAGRLALLAASCAGLRSRAPSTLLRSRRRGFATRSRRASRSARRACVDIARAGVRPLARASTAWGSAPRSCSPRSRCCSRSGSPRAAAFKGDAFVAGSVVGDRRRWSRSSRSSRSSKILLSGAAGRRRRVRRSPRSSQRLFDREDLGPRLHRRRHALRRRVEHAGARAARARSLCTALGLAFALIVTRTALPVQARCCASLSVLPIITPPFVIGLGLILLFGRSGLVNQFLEWAFGIEPTRWIYGYAGRAGRAGVRVHADRLPRADRRRRRRVADAGGSRADAARRTAGARSPTSRCR